MKEPVHTYESLDHYSGNVFSQFGEDGIIVEILKRLEVSRGIDRWCVEFGAWDGLYMSNTANLIGNSGFRAVLIEADKRKHKELCRNFPSDAIVKLCKFVTFDGATSLDSILSTTAIPRDFDFLSIDVDGCDYHILESVRQFAPKLVCIEFNPTIPNEVYFVQAKDFRIKQGSSAKALLELAERMGYALVALTRNNLILVRSDLRSFVLGSRTYTLDELRDDSDSKTYMFCGYDGEILLSRDRFRMPWIRMEFRASDFQQIPKFLRGYRKEYSPLQQIAFSAFLLWKRPGRVFSFLRNKLRHGKDS